MKNKGLLITTLIFFLIINTAYFWEGKFELFAFPAFALLFIFYIVLAVLFLRQLFISIKEKFSDKQRLLVIISLAIVLTTTYLKPNGLINFDKLEGKDLLVAEREGSANCMTTFKLKDNNRFIVKSICFGITEVKGTYTIKSDTIFFSNVQLGRGDKTYYKFAVIKPSIFQNEEITSDLVMYKNNNDTLPYELWITKNDLKLKNETVR